MVGLANFPRFKTNSDLAKFIEEVAQMDSNFLEANHIKQTKKFLENKFFFSTLAVKVKQQAIKIQHSLDN